MRQNKYSNLKIVNFPDKLESFVLGTITAPIYVRIKPTNICDDDCHFCTYAQSNRKPQSTVIPDGLPHIVSQMHTEMQERDIIPVAKLIEVLDDFHAMDVKAVTYSGGGEPLIYKDIVKVMETTLRHDIDLSIITNGRHLRGDRAEALSQAKWVRISIDYTNAGQRALFRRVPERSFDDVMTNIQEFAKIKENTCDLAVNYIVHQQNSEGLVALAKMLKGFGVSNVRFSPVVVGIGIQDLQNYHAPIKASVSAQLQEAQSLVDENFSINSTFELNDLSYSAHRTYSRCYFMQTVPVIGADQCVYACHNKAYDKTGLIGSIKDRSFRNLWYSAEAKSAFENLNPQCVCKHQCANDAKNRNFQSLIEMAGDNFI